VDPSFIAVGMAGALYRYLNEQGKEQTAANAAAALKELGGIESEQAIRYYQMLLDGKTIADLRVAAERDRRAAMEDMV